MATVVGAPRIIVWSALTEPEEALHWRPGAQRLLESPPGELAPGRLLRLRCLLQDVPVVLEERTVEVEPGKRLRTQVRFGLFRFEELFSLADADAMGAHTRLRLRIATASQTPLLGGSLDRFAVRRFATELAATYLAALRDWCELHHAHASARLPALSREHSAAQ